MNTNLHKYRSAILICIALLSAVLVVMVYNLTIQLRQLSTADSENMQWSIAQLDTEFANLDVDLSKELAGERTRVGNIGLSIDIALSRLRIVNSGQAASVLREVPASKSLLDRINSYSDQVVEIVDQTDSLGQVELRAIRDLTEEIRPVVRRLSSMGVVQGAANAEQRRIRFAQLLALTGGVAIALIVAMAGLMVVLRSLLIKAAQSDAELMVTADRLASTVSASLDAIIVTNETGEILEFNEAAEQMFGWNAGDILGKDIAQTLIPPRFQDAYVREISALIDGGTPRILNQDRVEAVALRRTGEEFPVELNATSFDEEDGQRLISYVRDISARKIDERTLIEARDRAERTDAAKSRFLAVMSHEMRTPLNGILGVLDLLSVSNLNKKQARYAKIATASSELLLEHVNEALDITRVETGTLKFVSQSFDPTELVSSVVEVLEPLALEKQIELSFDVEAAAKVPLDGDENRLRQILFNLVGNAIKFTKHGGVEVRIACINGPENSSLKIEVQDTGQGIAPEFQEDIFEDFIALAHGDARQTRGDGLGLSISRKIARLMGGDLQVKSKLGEGSTFVLTVVLPRSASNAKKEKGREISTLPLTATLRKRILVVEDNAINRSILSDMLIEMGHFITEAANGLEAIEECQSADFDLIIMDISMPKMDGLEATRRIRAQGGKNAVVPIIGLTAHGYEEYQQIAREAGMTHFHTKPLRLAVLRHLVGHSNGIEMSNPPHANQTISELLAALGPEKLEQTGREFFGEVERFIDEVRTSKNMMDLANSGHTLKGGAAVLGFFALENAIHSVLREVKFNDGLNQRAATVKHLQNAKENAMKEFEGQLSAEKIG